MVNAIRDRSINLRGKRITVNKYKGRKANFIPTKIQNVGMRERGCAGCGLQYRRDQYTKSQWLRGVGASECNTCLHGVSTTHKIEHVGSDVLNGERSAIPNAENTFRYNNSYKVDFHELDLNVPF